MALDNQSGIQVKDIIIHVLLFFFPHWNFRHVWNFSAKFKLTFVINLINSSVMGQGMGHSLYMDKECSGPVKEDVYEGKETL